MGKKYSREEIFEKFEDIDFVNDDFGCSFGK